MSIKQTLAKQGEKNPRAKLNQHKVKAIRKVAAKSNLVRGWKSKLAAKYEVSPSVISDIIAGKTWKNVDKDEGHLFE